MHPTVSFVIRQTAYLPMKTQVARNLNLDFEIARARTREMCFSDIGSLSLCIPVHKLDGRWLLTYPREENDEK